MTECACVAGGSLFFFYPPFSLPPLSPSSSLLFPWPCNISSDLSDFLCICVLMFVLIAPSTYYLNALFLRVCGIYLFAFRMWTKIETGIAYLQNLNFGWGKWIVSKCQVCQHCSCVLRRENRLKQIFRVFLPN